MFLVVVRIVLLFAVLFVIYLGLVAYARWQRRQVLAEEYASGDGGALTQEDYISKGLAEYERSWERKLLYGVFVLPLIVGAILITLSQLT